jgi:CreA protein
MICIARPDAPYDHPEILLATRSAGICSALPSSLKDFVMKDSRFFPKSVAVVALCFFCASLSPLATAELIGEVDTAFRWLGKDDRVVVEAYDDPKVHGVTCYVSRARTGGVTGTVGLAEDKAEASIACRQVGDTIHFAEKLPRQEDVFTERMSILFKRLHVVRVVDPKRHVLIYLAYSDKLIEGSPKNSISAVSVPHGMPIPLK